ncbi:unnamed protein product [Pedinophyceae sp. YPF-701]|nr:unnamed protein product [Pedinophyceae sp. YPF-701]
MPPARRGESRNGAGGAHGSIGPTGAESDAQRGLGSQRWHSKRGMHSGEAPKRSMAIRYKTNMRATVVPGVLQRRAGWVEVTGPTGEQERFDWDLFWGDINTFIKETGFLHAKMSAHQRINHFPRNYELCRKDLMATNLKKAKRKLEREGRGGELDFFPPTFSLPSDWGIFMEKFRAEDAVWIAKPVGRAQGRGIFLVSKISQLKDFKKKQPGGGKENENVESYVVQKYIERPLLIGSRKFDIRLYVLVLSFRPLLAYTHRGGFCRFTSCAYNAPQKENISNLGAHLTNHAIQRKTEDFHCETGNKWPIRALKLFMISKYGKDRTENLFMEMERVILRSLQAVQDAVVQDWHCFELYGYDVMVDSDLRPQLIEVNAQPSLSASDPEDRRLKAAVVRDALDLVDMEGHFRGQLPDRAGGFDILVRDDLPPQRVAANIGTACPFE